MSSQKVKAEPSRATPNRAPENTQPAASPERRDGELIEFSIKDAESGEIRFRVKAHTPFQKVFKAWADKKKVDAAHYRFLTADGGARIHPYQTPSQVNLENGDVVDAMAEQLGGISYSGDALKAMTMRHLR